MYAAIRQGTAKAGMAEELARRIKEGAIPIISDVPGFQAYYVIYAPNDTVTAISIFDDYAGAQESNRRGLAWIEQNLTPLLTGPATAVAGPVIVHTWLRGTGGWSGSAHTRPGSQSAGYAVGHIARPIAGRGAQPPLGSAKTIPHLARGWRPRQSHRRGSAPPPNKD